MADSFGVKAIGGIPDSQGDPLYTETTLNLNGKTEMTYVAMDGALVMQVVSQGISTKLVVSIAGTEFETPMGADSGGGGIGSGAPGSITPFEYTCDPAYLALAPVLHAELYKGNVWEFQKVKP